MSLPNIFGKLLRLGPARQVALGSAGTDSVSASSDLDVVIPKQNQGNWCWAATALGISDFYTHGKTEQCKFVARALSLNPDDFCCTNGADRKCNRQWYLQSALRLAGCFDRLEEGDTAFPLVKDEIDNKRPLGVRVQWTRGDRRGGGHFVAITGWTIGATGTHYVRVRDPWGPATELLTPDELTTSYGTDNGEWTHSYFTVEPAIAATLGGSSGRDDHRPELLGG